MRNLTRYNIVLAVFAGGLALNPEVLQAAKYTTISSGHAEVQFQFPELPDMPNGRGQIENWSGFKYRTVQPIAILFNRSNEWDNLSYAGCYGGLEPSNKNVTCTTRFTLDGLPYPFDGGRYDGNPTLSISDNSYFRHIMWDYGSYIGFRIGFTIPNLATGYVRDEFAKPRLALRNGEYLIQAVGIGMIWLDDGSDPTCDYCTFRSTLGEVSVRIFGAVPEPKSWAMMVSGLLVMGSRVRANRRRALPR